MAKVEQTNSGKLILVAMGDIESMGCRALHAYLKDKGVDIEVVFLKDRVGNEVPEINDSDINVLLKTLAEMGPALVGLSFFSGMLGDAVRITKRVQNELKLPVLWGGIHAIVRPEESVSIADAVCIGEGEEALLDFFQRFMNNGNYEETPGFWVRRDGTIYRNDHRPLIQDLDLIPQNDYEDEGKTFVRNDGSVYVGEPFFDGTGRSGYFQTSFFIQASRGCPYDCTYCSNSALKRLKTSGNRYFRTKSVANTISELQYAKKKFPKLKDISFRDEIFAFSGENLVIFCKEYKEKIGLPFRSDLFPTQINEERLGLMAEAGLYYLNTGIQSGSYRVRKDVFGRDTSDELLLSKAHILRAAGIAVAYDIISDNPWEKEADRKEAIEFLLQLPTPFDMRVFSLCHLPETQLTLRGIEEGVFTANEVEGYNDKSRTNWRMMLNREKSPAEMHWNLALSLVSKSFVPRGLIRHVYYSKFWRGHLGLLNTLVKVMNILKTGLKGVEYLFKGKINLAYIRTSWRNAINVNR